MKRCSRRRSRSPTSALVTMVALATGAACAPAGDRETGTDPDAAGATGAAGSTADSAAAQGQFEFTEIVPGVYHARGVGDLVAGSNAGVVVNESDVLLVDSHITPAAATALLDELRRITDKPVRYVANTHWHFDHSHGNQIYPPEVEIISHEATRAVIAAGGSISGRSYDFFIGSVPGQIAEMEAALDTITDAAARAELEANIESTRTFHAQTQEVVPTPPNTTLSERLTLHRGDREIRFLFFGRGHTEGDVVVHLPDDGVLITGDLITAGVPYMGDGFVDEWIETLEHLKSLEFEWILPGHGAAYRDRDRIGQLQDYLRDLWSQAVSHHERGVPAEEAATLIDLSAHADPFGVTGPGVSPVAVVRIYELLDAEG